MLFQMERVGFSYVDGLPAVRELSFEVADGEKLAILGANGSGKSTLLKLMDGLIFAQAGRVLYRGTILSTEALKQAAFHRAFRSGVGLVFQNADFQLFSSTVNEEIAFGPKQLGLSDDEIEQRVVDILKLMRLESLRERPPYELSGGEKKRVAIASVLATNPGVLLLDEPTLALDPRSRWELVDILLELHAAGKTIVTATNDLEIVQSVADRLVILDESRTVLKTGPTFKLLADPDLLQQANLIHIHAHRHKGAEHRHPHTHPGHIDEHHPQ
jgi:cobalt/nickel transport system ATP-binding protein